MGGSTAYESGAGAFVRAARNELKVAEHNKGGWRARALTNTERAISETEAGMRH
jgi:hypothetical protein